MDVETTLLGREYSGPELAERAGLTYRRLDYLVRRGVIVPVQESNGQGTRRVFNDTSLIQARLAVVLRDLGAPLDVIATAIGRLAPDPNDWPEFFFVDAEGDIKRGLPLPSACWWVHKAALLEVLELTAA